MAIDLMKARLLKSGDIITPKGRMMYPNLFKPSMPKGETDEKKLQYQVNLLLPKGADLSVMVAAVNEVIVGKWGADAKKKFKIKMPFKKVEDEPKLAELAHEFPTTLRAWSKDRPTVVMADPTKLAQEEDVYSGRWACIMLRPFVYDHPTGGKGISFGLQHVQILDNDEPLVGARIRAQDGFETVEDSSGSAVTTTDDLY